MQSSEMQKSKNETYQQQYAKNGGQAEAVDQAATSDEPFSIYTRRQKISLILAGAIAAFFSPMSANIYLPALNSIANDSHVSYSLITLTVTVYLIFQGLAPTFVGGFSDSAGRRPAYIICFVIYIAANIGLALQHSFTALLVLRCIQSSGSSGTVALANAVAADIVTSAERGEYIGYTSLPAILAPTLAPVIGGLLSQYAGWRWIFWFLIIFAISFFVPFFLFFPETCRKIVGNGSIPPPPLNHSLPSYLKERRLKREGRDDVFVERDARARARKLRFPNPTSTLRIIFTKTAGLCLLVSGLLFACYYVVTATLPSQFQQRYGLNDLQISLIFLPFGVGSLISAFTTGRLIDMNFRRHARRLGVPVDRNRQRDLTDFPIERARLEIALPVLYLGAASIISYGWMMESGVSIPGPCIMLFLLGYSITAGFNSMNILLIDMYPGKPATATAANNLVRCWMGAGATAIAVPLINAIRFGWTCTLCATVWASFGPVFLLLMKYGPKWRLEAKEAEEAKQLKERNFREMTDKQSSSPSNELRVSINKSSKEIEEISDSLVETQLKAVERGEVGE